VKLHPIYCQSPLTKVNYLETSPSGICSRRVKRPPKCLGAEHTMSIYTRGGRFAVRVAEVGSYEVLLEVEICSLTLVV
jgi:hypothetical protein